MCIILTETMLSARTTMGEFLLTCKNDRGNLPPSSKYLKRLDISDLAQRGIGDPSSSSSVEFSLGSLFKVVGNGQVAPSRTGEAKAMARRGGSRELDVRAGTKARRRFPLRRLLVSTTLLALAILTPREARADLVVIQE